MQKRFLTGLLTLCLVVNLLPISVLAAGIGADAFIVEDATDAQTEEAVADEQEEKTVPDGQKEDVAADKQGGNAADADISSSDIQTKVEETEAEMSEEAEEAISLSENDIVLGENEDAQASLEGDIMPIEGEILLEDDAMAERDGDAEDQETKPMVFADTVTSGTWGENLTWMLEDGTLTISGTGEMSYYYSSIPWNDSRDKISKIIISNGVTNIGYYAFSGCNSLTNITIPDSVTSIDSDAFSGCNSLTNITIPDSVTSIGYGAFSGCNSLTEVYISNIESWCDINFNREYSNPLNNGARLYVKGNLVEDLIIPDGMTSIGAYTFCGCSSLTSITIPDSVTSIGYGAFSGCNSLTKVCISSMESWYNISFFGSGSNPMCNGAELYVNGNLVAGDLIIPDNVTSIKDYVFYRCSSLTSITIPDSVTSIGDDAFVGCSGLESIIIPNGVISIGDEAFSGCTNLTSITIPDSVTSIGVNAFGNCNGLKVYISSIESWCNIEFKTGYGVPYNLPWSNPLNYRGDLYVNGDLVEDLIIPNGVTSISAWAFQGCKSLTSITIPDSVTNVGYGAFCDCHNLQSITIPDSATSISQYVFYCCYSLTSIIIPERVTSIGEAAFAGCGSLSNMTIPDSVTSIGESAFSECSSLQDIYYSGSENNWKAIIIDYWNEPLTTATIHYNSTGPGTGPGTGSGTDPGIGGDGDDISKIKINGKSIQSLFSQSSFVYDNDLALFAANLSGKAEDKTGENILNYYRSLEWPEKDREIYQYGGDRAYSIACAKLSKDENLLVITARGSQTVSELFEDGLSFGHRDFFGCKTNDVVYDFERDIMIGLNIFLADHPYLMDEDLKILIAGHSLGGAAANLNAARFTIFEDGGLGGLT